MAWARAFLGNDTVGHVFKFNPDSVEWSYQNNINSQDTIGGRVVQLLSVQITSMTFMGKAGSRAELQRLGQNIAAIMKYHVKTQRPVTLSVPSRKWRFHVYVAAMPQLGWNVQTVAYPFQLQLLVEDDLIGTKVNELKDFALRRLNPNIEFNENFHGGDATSFKEIVTNVLKSTQAPTPTFTPTTGGTGGLAATVIEAAKSQIGVPYTFSTEDPTGQGKYPKQGGREHDTSGASFDCSGLSQWAYAQAGINISGVSQSQYQELPIHPKQSELVPSDLVFFWFANDRGAGASIVSHVGIYVGNGKMIDAPGTGLKVRYDDLSNYTKSYVGAGRSNLMTFGSLGTGSNTDGKGTFGIDLYHANCDVVPAAKIKSAGVSFAILKVSQGISYSWADSWFPGNAQTVLNNGLILGGYHMLDGTSGTGAQQASYFLSKLKPQSGYIIPIVDFEASGRKTESLSSYAAKVQEFISTVHTAGFKCMIYGHADVKAAFSDWRASGADYWWVPGDSAHNDVGPQGPDVWQYGPYSAPAGYPTDPAGIGRSDMSVVITGLPRV